MFHCKFLIFLGKPIQPTALWQQVRSKDKLRFNVNTSSKVKWELTPQGQLALRLVFLLERQFIDDPVGSSDENAFIALRGNLEGLFNCKAYPVSMPLNGFMQTNHFFKSDPRCKDLIKLLKTYLIGSDAVLRIWDTQSNFDVLYSKFKTN